MYQQKNIVESILRALRAEEKQGFINTGAIGGFSSFLLEVLPRLETLVPIHIYERLHAIAGIYGELSPYKRKGLLAELKQLLLTLPIQQDLSNKQIQTEFNSQSNDIVQSTQNNVQKRPVKTKDEDRSLQYIKGVGPERAKQFENLGILTVRDLLRHYPRRYETRTNRKIEDLVDGELATVSGTVIASNVTQGRVKVVKLGIQQNTKTLYAVWFNQVHIPKQYPVGSEVTVSGKVQWNKRIPELLVTEIAKGFIEGEGEEIIPVYSETARLNSKMIRGIIKGILPQADKLFPEYLERNEYDLMGRIQAFKEIHFPSSQSSLLKARERLVIEEVLFIQLALAQMRSPQKKDASLVLNLGIELVKRFISTLPYSLTQAQRKVIQEIFRDMGNGQKAMTRLLQGDVGSGKTAVAMAAILQAVGSGFQAAMMAPTEVLAQQHFDTLSKSFEVLGVKVSLLAGNQTKAEREQILSLIYSGKTHVVVGTHALIQETVRFHALGLVVTDEQHRFGVRQRTILQDKGENPHVLVMTATPIPRTLALTLYGDLQLSILDEMPAGRKSIITKKVTERNRSSLEKFMEQQVQAGRQVYVVCPLVEETEKSDLVSATQRAESLVERFAQYKVALLHGRMKGQDKEEIMRRFRDGEIDILVATTVVEVGVNVPNASVMVIEGAERFGLAQLHQLRGRVGRGTEQSYCILMSNVRDSARLNILCETEDGFRIAEEDLKLRGPGELLGIKQHGVPELKLVDLNKDGKLIEIAYLLLQKALNTPAQHHMLYHEIQNLYSPENIGVN